MAPFWPNYTATSHFCRHVATKSRKATMPSFVCVMLSLLRPITSCYHATMDLHAFQCGPFGTQLSGRGRCNTSGHYVWQKYDWKSAALQTRLRRCCVYCHIFTVALPSSRQTTIVSSFKKNHERRSERRFIGNFIDSKYISYLLSSRRDDGERPTGWETSNTEPTRNGSKTRIALHKQR